VTRNEKLVVLYVQFYEEATIDRLQRDLGLSTITLMTLVERLAEREVLAVEDGVVGMAHQRAGAATAARD
jgi:predicted DNA-binding transcriptional regulator